MKKIILMILLLLMPVLSVNAKQIYFDDEVKVRDEINRSAFIAGNKIKNEATIDGIAFTAGDTIEDNSQSNYAFIAGREITIDSKIDKDIFIAGDYILMRKSAKIGRDAFIFANTIKISGEIDGNINVYGSSVDLSDATILGNIYIVANKINIKENVIVDGKLSYNDDAKFNIDDESKETINNIHVYENKLNFNERFINTTYRGLKAFIGMLFIAFLIYLTMPKLITKINYKHDNLLKTFGKGFLILLAVPIISIFLLASWFGTPLGFILIILYALSIYFTTLFISILVGKLIWKKVFKKDDNYMISTLIGLLTIYFLKFLPYIGGYTTIFITVFGLGYIWELFRKHKNKLA